MSEEECSQSDHMAACAAASDSPGWRLLVFWCYNNFANYVLRTFYCKLNWLYIQVCQSTHIHRKRAHPEQEEDGEENQDERPRQRSRRQRGDGGDGRSGGNAGGCSSSAGGGERVGEGQAALRKCPKRGAGKTRRRRRGNRNVVVGGQVGHKIPAGRIRGGDGSQQPECEAEDRPKYAKMHSHLPDPDSDGEPEIDDEDYSDVAVGHWRTDGLGPQVTPRGHMLITNFGLMGCVARQEELRIFFNHTVNSSISSSDLRTLSPSTSWNSMSPSQTVTNLLNECRLLENAQSFADLRHMMALIQLAVYVDR
jgi:hypothetical protein